VICALCRVHSEQPVLIRDPQDPHFAYCPRCHTRIPNYDGVIKFKGRPPGAKNVKKDEPANAT
jgi:hypothetical protein